MLLGNAEGNRLPGGRHGDADPDLGKRDGRREAEQKCQHRGDREWARRAKGHEGRLRRLSFETAQDRQILDQVDRFAVPRPVDAVEQPVDLGDGIRCRRA